MAKPLKLIVGVGNPGAQYADTRHNVGVWFVERLAQRMGLTFKAESRFKARVATGFNGQEKLFLLIPDTYMNESGLAVGPFVNFYKLDLETMLVAHDELDFPIGKIRFKQSGGLAGHNGLRSISSSLGGANNFNRLRIGVGHPGTREHVIGHVLGKASAQDRDLIERCLDAAFEALPDAMEGNWQKAMNHLHNTDIPGIDTGDD